MRFLKSFFCNNRGTWRKIFILPLAVMFMWGAVPLPTGVAATKQTARNTPAKKAASAAAAGAAATGAVAGSAETLPENQKNDEIQEEVKKWPEGSEGDAGRAYSRGDYEEARRIWEKMAASGDSQAMNNLGVLYDQGKGVDVDAGRAVYWFAQSANAGNPAGMSNYGRMLEQGRGIPANPEEAARWFDQAARKGQPEAQYNLGFLYENGRGVPKDDAAAAAWYSRAASLKQPDALARLGHLFRNGQGVAKNEERGALLLYAAAMEGSTSAIRELEEMARENPKKSEAVLFGQQLNNTTRTGMRDALRKIGAVARREDDKKICDIYNAANIVPGAQDMAICYGPSGQLAFVKIDYAAQDNNRANAILKMVESRFGKPTAGEGEDSRMWNLGPVIVATQYAPTHQQMSLMYMVPKVYHLTQRD